MESAGKRDVSTLKALRTGLVIALTAVLCIFAVGCEKAADEPAAPAPPTAQPTAANTAPDFTLNDLSGEPVTLSRYRGKANVLLHFGTTWCPPCRAQVPLLKELHQTYTSDELVILSVHIMESPEVVRSFAEDEKAPYLTLLDADGAVALEYGAEFIPLNVLVDKSGAIHGTPSNALDVKAIRELVGR